MPMSTISISKPPPATHKPGRTPSAVEVLRARYAAESQQTPPTHREPLSPIEMDSTGSWKSLSGVFGGGPVQSTLQDSPAAGRANGGRRQLNGTGAGKQRAREPSATYTKRRPMGMSKHQQEIAQRDQLDRDGLSWAGPASPAVGPPPPALAPFSSSPRPPPSPPAEANEGRSALQRFVAEKSDSWQGEWLVAWQWPRRCHGLLTAGSHFAVSAAIREKYAPTRRDGAKASRKSYTSVEQSLLIAKQANA